MSDDLERDARYVERVRRSQRPFLALGILLALTGAAYLTWGIARYKPWLDPRENPGFDQPVANLAFLFDRHEAQLEVKAQHATPEERRLMRGLTRNMEFSAGIMVLLLRMFLGTLTLVFGFAIMTVVVERARLLAVLERRRE